MAHDGFARSIAPVHTSGDGDSIIALSVPAQSSGNGFGPAADVDNKNCLSASGGEPVIAGIDTVGTLAAWAASEAILQGVRSAESMYGYRALKDLPL